MVLVVSAVWFARESWFDVGVDGIAKRDNLPCFYTKLMLFLYLWKNNFKSKLIYV